MLVWKHCSFRKPFSFFHSGRWGLETADAAAAATDSGVAHAGLHPDLSCQVSVPAL